MFFPFPLNHSAIAKINVKAANKSVIWSAMFNVFRQTKNKICRCILYTHLESQFMYGLIMIQDVIMFLISRVN